MRSQARSRLTGHHRRPLRDRHQAGTVATHFGGVDPGPRLDEVSDADTLGAAVKSLARCRFSFSPADSSTMAPAGSRSSRRLGGDAEMDGRVYCNLVMRGFDLAGARWLAGMNPRARSAIVAVGTALTQSASTPTPSTSPNNQPSRIDSRDEGDRRRRREELGHIFPAALTRRPRGAQRRARSDRRDLTRSCGGRSRLRFVKRK